MRSHRSHLAILFILALTLTVVPSVAADQVQHSAHVPLFPVWNAPLRSGFVENIHANGPIIYAHENYLINGAEPNTSFDVYLSVFGSTDSGCTGLISGFPLYETTLTTNQAGNAQGHAVFTPADVDGLSGNTVDAMWTFTLSGPGTPVYQSACTTVTLD